MRVSEGPALRDAGYLTEQVGADEIIGVEGPCFGLVTIRLTWLAGTVDVAPAAGRACWDLLERGTAERERADWFTDIEALGASLEARIGRTWASLEFDALAPYIEQASTLAIEPVLAPNDDPEELDDWRSEVAEELAADLEDVEGAVERLWPAALWEDQLWGRLSTGTDAERKALDGERLAACRAQLFGAPLVVTIAADDPAAHVPLVRRLIEQVRAAYAVARPGPRAVPVLRPGGAWVSYPDTDQGALRVALACAAPADDAWAATSVHATMFGGGFTSPLLRRIRGELGLSYEVSWSASAQPGAGLWSGRILPASADVRRTWDELGATWDRFREGPVDPSLLALARSLLIGQHLSSLETAGARAAHAALLRAFDLPLERSWTLPARIRAVDERAIEAVSAGSGGLGDASWAAGVRSAAEAPPGGAQWEFGAARDVPSRLAKSAGDR